MNIDEETLINIIRQEIEKVLEDLDLLMPLPLQAEPPARLPLTEPQQHIKESKGKRSKLQLAQALINSMIDSKRWDPQKGAIFYASGGHNEIFTKPFGRKPLMEEVKVDLKVKIKEH